MAQLFLTRLVDDLDGTDAAEKVQFALDGKDYEIDLSEANAETLRTALCEYVAAARPKGRVLARQAAPSPRRRSRSEQLVDRASNQKIRDWARAAGLECAARGRIPADVLEKYRAAHPA